MELLERMMDSRNSLHSCDACELCMDSFLINICFLIMSDYVITCIYIYCVHVYIAQFVLSFLGCSWDVCPPCHYTTTLNFFPSVTSESIINGWHFFQRGPNTLLVIAQLYYFMRIFALTVSLVSRLSPHPNKGRAWERGYLLYDSRFLSIKKSLYVHSHF